MDRKFWLAGVGLAGLFAIWLSANSWSLGFGIINALFLTSSAIYFKEIGKNNFLKIMWSFSLALGMMMAVRDNDFSRILSAAAVISLNIIMLAIAKAIEVKLDIIKIILVHLGMVFEFFGLIKLIKWNQKYDNETIKKIIIGVVLAIPLLLVFGGLFYGADPIFAKLINQIRWPNIKINAELVWRIISSGVFFGAVLAVWRIKMAENTSVFKFKKWTEVNIAVAILEVLIAIFCLIQIRYFFAGPEEFRKLGIVFSEYTRNGYNQMILASILAYGIITVLKINSFLSWGMVSEILILIVSATKRNFIYQSVYGFTEIRLLGFFLSGWLVAMVLIVGYQMLKNKSDDWQMRAIILLSALTIVTLDIFNIDGTIVKTKPASYDWGIDYQYMANLSDDGYLGYDKILTELEARISNNKFENLDQVNESILLTNNLKWKYEKDQRYAKNNWNWLGAWNYSSSKSYKYLQDNHERINSIEEKLKKIESNLRNKSQQNARGKIKKSIDEMMAKIKKLDGKATAKETSTGGNADYTVSSVVEIQTGNMEKAKLLVPSICWIKTNTDTWMMIECEKVIN